MVFSIFYTLLKLLLDTKMESSAGVAKKPGYFFQFCCVLHIIKKSKAIFTMPVRTSSFHEFPISFIKKKKKSSEIFIPFFVNFF